MICQEFIEELADTEAGVKAAVAIAMRSTRSVAQFWAS
jgi:hypothetical protein